MSDARAGSTIETARPAATGELWIFSQDPRRLGTAYALLVAFGLVLGTLLAVGLVLQDVAGPGGGNDPDVHRRIFTVHGMAMVFGVLLPAIPGVLGNWLLPKRLGVAELAWPRLNLLAFQLLCAAWLLFLIAFLFAPPATGYAFDLALSRAPGANAPWSMLAVLFAVASVALTGAVHVATLFTGRAGRGGLAAVPFVGWAFGVAGLLQVLAAPALVVALAFLFADRSGASDALAGAAADVRLDRWTWAFAQPAFAGALIAAAGVIGDVFATRGDARATPGPAAFASVLALVGAATVALASSAVHTAWRGAGGSGASGALALALGVPLAVLVADWLGALSRGRVVPSAALWLSIAAAVGLVAGALAAAFLASPATGPYLEGSRFPASALHLFAVVGVLGAAFAGMYAFLGERARQGAGRLSAALLVLGAAAAFVPPGVLGFLGEAGRSSELTTARDSLAWTSAAGALAVVTALSFAAWGLFAAWLEVRAESRAASEPEERV